jgi:hypothetical protein
VHAKELEYLSKHDPEFMDYLRENDAELLEFTKNNEQEDKEGGQGVGGKVVTPGLLASWVAQAQSGSLKSVKKLLEAFRSASHMSDSKNGEEEESKYPYRVVSPDVYNQLISSCVKNMPTYLSLHLKKGSQVWLELTSVLTIDIAREGEEETSEGIRGRRE